MQVTELNRDGNPQGPQQLLLEVLWWSISLLEAVVSSPGSVKLIGKEAVHFHSLMQAFTT